MTVLTFVTCLLLLWCALLLLAEVVVPMAPIKRTITAYGIVWSAWVLMILGAVGRH